MNELDRFQERLTTIFLTNTGGTKIMLLKRAETKKFAPGLYTGTGGKFETGETAQQCAERELFEETGIKTQLTEFARLIFNGNQRILCQFTGVYEDEDLPACTEGELFWVERDNAQDLMLIPTAKIFLDEWRKRSWDTKKPFTIFVERKDLQDLYGPIQSLQIVEGLRFTFPVQ